MRSHVIVYLCELFPTEIDAFQNEDHINAIKFDAIKHQIVAPNFNSICHINWQHAIYANRQIENKQPNILFRLLFQNVIKNRLIERFLDVFRIFFSNPEYQIFQLNRFLWPIYQQIDKSRKTVINVQSRRFFFSPKNSVAHSFCLAFIFIQMAIKFINAEFECRQSICAMGPKEIKPMLLYMEKKLNKDEKSHLEWKLAWNCFYFQFGHISNEYGPLSCMQWQIYRCKFALSYRMNQLYNFFSIFIFSFIFIFI